MSEESTANFAPLVKLDVVKVETGEEEEETMYEQRSRLYRFDNGEWKERGTGNVKLLRNRETNTVRVLLRQEKTGKLVMNHQVHENIELTPNMGSDKAWTWVTTDYADAEPAMQTFAIKFKNAEIANTFKNKFDELKKGGDASEPNEKDSNDENVWEKILSDRRFDLLTQEDIKALWTKYDADKSDALDVREVTNLMRDLVTAVFKTFHDKDVSGELQAHVEAYLPTLVERMVAKLDKNDDSKLSYEEFMKLNEVQLISE